MLQELGSMPVCHSHSALATIGTSHTLDSPCPPTGAALHAAVAELGVLGCCTRLAGGLREAIRAALDVAGGLWGDARDPALSISTIAPGRGVAHICNLLQAAGAVGPGTVGVAAGAKLAKASSWHHAPHTVGG